jgi:hypothetical protein
MCLGYFVELRNSVRVTRYAVTRPGHRSHVEPERGRRWPMWRKTASFRHFVKHLRRVCVPFSPGFAGPRDTLGTHFTRLPSAARPE